MQITCGCEVVILTINIFFTLHEGSVTKVAWPQLAEGVARCTSLWYSTLCQLNFRTHRTCCRVWPYKCLREKRSTTQTEATASCFWSRQYFHNNSYPELPMNVRKLHKNAKSDSNVLRVACREACAGETACFHNVLRTL